MARKEQPEELPKLSEMEWEVMKPLWDHGPMAARDIYERMPEEFGWAYETLKTMLSRLVKKGALTYVQVGNSFLYRPAYTRREMSRDAVGSLLHRVFDGTFSLLFAQFVEEVSPAERAAIKAELERVEKESSKKRGKRP